MENFKYLERMLDWLDNDWLVKRHNVGSITILTNLTYDPAASTVVVFDTDYDPVDNLLVRTAEIIFFSLI